MRYSEHPEGSWEADEDFATQAFVMALNAYAPISNTEGSSQRADDREAQTVREAAVFDE